MPSEQPDAQLLRARNADAWDDLYMATCRRTYRVLCHVTGANPAVLEELNQEVWLAAIESIGGFDAARGTAHDWVLGIARFKGLTYLRKQYASQLAYVGACSDLPETIDVARDAPDIDERIAMLRASVESLPENWQYVLRQKYEQGMSVKEISDLVGTTPKGIESTLSRARQRLRELFQDTFRQGTSQ